MINLIPPIAKKNLLKEYWVRVVSTWLIVWSVAMFASASILYPAYFLIGDRASVYEDSAKEASLKVANFESVSESLVRASVEARVVVTESSIPVFSEYITLFESLQGSEIQLNKISLNRDATGIKPVLLTGIANNRQSLATFRDQLLAEEQVTSVDLPIANLAKDKDIDFTITVVLNNNETDV